MVLSNYTIPLLTGCSGIYSLNVPLTASGEFEYTATAKSRNLPEEIVKGKFTVQENIIENSNSKADYNVLKKISQNTGGRFYPVTDINKISGDLNYSQKTILKEKKIKISDFYILLFLWIAALSTEWFLRKKWKVE